MSSRPGIPPRLGRYRVAALLGVAASLGATALIVGRTGATLADVTTGLPAWAHIAALACVALHIGGRALRLVFIARGSGTRLPFGGAAVALLAGDAAAAVTPSRVGADPAKLYFFGRYGHTVGTSASIIAGEMIAEVAMLTLVCVAVAAVSSAFRLPALGALIYAAVVLGTTSALLLAGRGMRGRARPTWLARVRVSEPAWRSFRAAAVHFYRRTVRLRRMRPALIVATAGATLVHMAGRLAVLPLLGATVAPAAPTGMLIAWPLLFLYAGALLPPPAGGGAIEVGFAATIGDAVPPASLASLLLWWRFYTFYLPALAGGVLAAATTARGRRSGERTAQQDRDAATP